MASEYERNSSTSSVPLSDQSYTENGVIENNHEYNSDIYNHAVFEPLIYLDLSQNNQYNRSRNHEVIDFSSSQHAQQTSDSRFYNEYSGFVNSSFQENYSRSFPNCSSQQVKYYSNSNFLNQCIENSTSKILRSNSCNNLQINNSDDNSKTDKDITSVKAKENSNSQICKRKKRLQTPTRKRKINKQLWLDVKSKEARNFGKEGEGRKGLITARKMKDGCSEKCRNKCRNKITLEERSSAFNQFWAIGDHTKQWACLIKWITKVPLQKKDNSDSDYDIKSDAEDDNKEPNFKHIFTLPNAEDKAVTICKKMFLDTLDISYQWIRTADKKIHTVNSTQIIESDQRGKHPNRPFRISDSARMIIKQHIESYPVIDSHYCRANTVRKYLEEGLSVSKMYRMYVEQRHLNYDNNIVSHQTYEKIFNYEYNYGFFKPKKDRCEQCEEHKNLSESEKVKNESLYSSHLDNKQIARKLMKSDKIKATNDNSICTINFDMQKVLTTPRADIGPLYYMCKLNVWNFTIFELGTKTGWCNLWNETIGNRGSNEISSFLWNFICNKSKSGVREFCLYSDNCGGQNRNKNVFSMLFKAANDFNVKISHRFLEVGHTQCDGDSMHARIEQHCARKSVFTQKEWVRLIQEAKTEKQYIVQEKEQKDIYNFEDLSNLFNWRFVRISKLRELVILPKDQRVYIKYDFTLEPQIIKILKKNIAIQSISAYQLKTAYCAKLTLNQKKKEDLLAMVDRNLIPNEFKEFYRNIVRN